MPLKAQGVPKIPVCQNSCQERYSQYSLCMDVYVQAIAPASSTHRSLQQVLFSCSFVLLERDNCNAADGKGKA